MNSDTRPLWKRAVSIVLPLLGLVFVVESTYSLYTFAKKGDVVGEERKRLQALEKKQEDLKKQLSDSYKPFFIEEEARNKLGLVKPGETLVYLEKESSETAELKSKIAGEDVEQQPGEEINVISEERTILQQWWDLFL